ncbi:conserved hypothetical protein [Hahella chejuensis KCTC 2396]|uniref:SAM-dependent methyltransferase n=1 Tax=Hahella chejuensis (strain KCTC 2396) TaxID=349521 RepID=Q2SJ70_HAHCH|nr:SAM-dependent methyltransferase [Hahella chejuensis]ABC29304.1 conserved hypothetical protein [Hahella chejuensis KCTC 2396]
MSFSNPKYYSNTATLYSAALDEGDYHDWKDSIITGLMGFITPFPEKMRINRAFVRQMYEGYQQEGFNNILDIGAGPIPRGHEWATEANIMYVDHNPDIVEHARRKLPVGASARYETSSVGALPGLLEKGLVDGFFDDSRKVAFGSNAVLMFVDDAEIKSTFQYLYDWCAPGSVLKISTTGITGSESDLRAKFIRTFFKKVNAPMHIRNVDKFCELLAPWKVTRRPMPLWEWVNWPPSKMTAGIGFDIYGIELRKE